MFLGRISDEPSSNGSQQQQQQPQAQAQSSRFVELDDAKWEEQFAKLEEEQKGEEAKADSKGKGKAKATAASTRTSTGHALPRLSQRSLFLALYAKFLSGEKRKDEDAEMVMGPQDLGTCINKQLLTVSRFLESWFEEHKTEDGEYSDSQGWLEYLYVLASSLVASRDGYGA